MTTRHDSCAVRRIARVAAAALLVVPLAPTAAAQSPLPRFERGNCLVMAIGPARSEVNAAGSSCRSRVIARAPIRSASPWRSFAPGSRAARRHSSFCTGARVVPGGSVCTRRVCARVHCPCIATS